MKFWVLDNHVNHNIPGNVHFLVSYIYEEFTLCRLGWRIMSDKLGYGLTLEGNFRQAVVITPARCAD